MIRVMTDSRSKLNGFQISPQHQTQRMQVVSQILGEIVAQYSYSLGWLSSYCGRLRRRPRLKVLPARHSASCMTSKQKSQSIVPTPSTEISQAPILIRQCTEYWSCQQKSRSHSCIAPFWPGSINTGTSDSLISGRKQTFFCHCKIGATVSIKQQTLRCPGQTSPQYAQLLPLKDCQGMTVHHSSIRKWPKELLGFLRSGRFFNKYVAC